MAFEMVELEKVCKITMGQAPQGDTYNDKGQGLALIAGAGDFGEKYPNPKKFTTAPNKISQIGELILCIRATIGDINIADKEYCLGRGVAGLIANEKELTQDYLRHFLIYSADFLRAKGKGATFLQISKQDVSNLQIPLPPLPTQIHIAKILDKADQLRQNRKIAIAKLDELLQATFVKMFGDPVVNDKGWEKDSLKNLAKVFTGKTPPSKNENMFDGDIPFITPSDLNGIIYRTNRTVTNEGAKFSKIIPKYSTVVCCIGTIGKIGFTLKESTFNQQINSITWLDKINPIFGYYLTSFYSNEFSDKATATTVPILKKSEFEKIAVIIPPKELQAQFAQIAQAIESQKSKFGAQLAELDTLFLALQQQVFTTTL